MLSSENDSSILCGNWSKRLNHLYAQSLSMHEKYRRWVTCNTNLARYFEHSFYITPQFIPKRACDSDVATEFVYAFVGLLHLYHDSILLREQQKEQKRDSPISYMNYIRVPLAIIGKIQTFAELMAKKHGGEVARWDIIVWIEIVKCLCKFALLKMGRRGLLFQNGQYRITEQNNKNSARDFGFHSAKGQSNVSQDASGIRIFSEDPTVPLQTRRENLLTLGELLHITRPVIYAILRARSTENSWTPAALSFICETLGLLATTTAAQNAHYNEKVGLELSSRKMALLLYFLRDPLYCRTIEPVTDKICSVTASTPVLGGLVRLMISGFVSYYHQYHFYTAAS